MSTNYSNNTLLAVCLLFKDPYVTLRFKVDNIASGSEEQHSVEMTVAEFQVSIESTADF